jgi:fused signal recognition particle receptor
LFSYLRERLSRVKNSLEDAGLKERTGALLRGEVIFDEKKLEEISQDIVFTLLEGDVALETAEEIAGSLKAELGGRKVKKRDIGRVLNDTLRSSLRKLLPQGPGLLRLIDEKEDGPFVILFVGVNGTGKTTTIAKVARLLQRQGRGCVIAASDTFRAGAIEQLEKHASKLGIKIIKHPRGSDPAAVAFDAVEHARARGKDVVLIDTAGRMETNVNLMDEMQKIARVAKADMVLFVGDSLTGNAAVEQAEKFHDALPIDGIILTKADADAKGGCAISIAHAIGRPILYLGTGQGYEDLKIFDPEWFLGELLG